MNMQKTSSYSPFLRTATAVAMVIAFAFHATTTTTIVMVQAIPANGLLGVGDNVVSTMARGGAQLDSGLSSPAIRSGLLPEQEVLGGSDNLVGRMGLERITSGLPTSQGALDTIPRGRVVEPGPTGTTASTGNTFQNPYAAGDGTGPKATTDTTTPITDTTTDAIMYPPPTTASTGNPFENPNAGPKVAGTEPLSNLGGDAAAAAAATAPARLDAALPPPGPGGSQAVVMGQQPLDNVLGSQAVVMGQPVDNVLGSQAVVMGQPVDNVLGSQAVVMGQPVDNVLGPLASSASASASSPPIVVVVFRKNPWFDSYAATEAFRRAVADLTGYVRANRATLTTAAVNVLALGVVGAAVAGAAVMLTKQRAVAEELTQQILEAVDGKKEEGMKWYEVDHDDLEEDEDENDLLANDRWDAFNDADFESIAPAKDSNDWINNNNNNIQNNNNMKDEDLSAANDGDNDGDVGVESAAVLFTGSSLVSWAVAAVAMNVVLLAWQSHD